MPALDQWERRLKPQFKRSLRIIGEIPLTRSDIEDMATGFRSCIERSGIAEATRQLTGKYPHVFLAFLAGFAAHNTEQSYWIALGNHLGIDHTKLFNHRWHHTFQEEVKRRGLQYFNYLDAATPYVTTVRFHGGIPAYSLPDFFERLVLPTVKRPALNEAPTRDAMAAVLRTAYFVDSPVINFLENSDRLGLEFFDSCRRMTRHYMETRGELLSAEELGLPEYVVEIVCLVHGAGRRAKRAYTQAGYRINPYDQRDRLLLLLPEQEIPLRYAAGTMQWEISWPGLTEPERLTCNMRRRRQDTVVDEIYFPITASPACIKIALIYNENGRQECLRRWTQPLLFVGRPTPIFAFSSSGVLINSSTTLPAGVLILAYPLDAEICLEGPGQKTEEYGAMEGNWGGWQIHAWDITQAWALQVCRNGISIGDIVSVAGRLPEPELVNGSLSTYGSDDSPLYIGEAPSIKIPLRISTDPVKELNRWQVKITSVWDTDPVISEIIPMSNCINQIEIYENEAVFNLKHKLGANAAGTYQIKVLGPGGSVKDFRIRLWPSLVTIGLSKTILPAEENHRPVCFALRLPEQTHCETQAGVDDVEVSRSSYGYDITVGPDTVEARLSLVMKGSKNVRVPISIPIPRLRWALALDFDQQKLNWTSSPLQKSALALLQSSTAALHIQAAGLKQLSSKVSVELVEIDEGEQILQQENLLPTVFSPDWMRISLQKFRGTLEHNCQQGRFDFVLHDYKSGDTNRIPVLSAPRQIQINHIELVQAADTCWKICWNEEFPLRNRRLMLLPAWQPWQEPWEFKVPDNNRGEFILEDVTLPYSRYHIYLYITPPGNLPALLHQMMLILTLSICAAPKVDLYSLNPPNLLRMKKSYVSCLKKL
jgi:hypothetical protein